MNAAPPCYGLTASVFTGVHQPTGLDPRHHAAQFLADLLDLMLAADAAIGPQHRRTGLILQNEFAGELAALDFLENLSESLQNRYWEKDCMILLGNRSHKKYSPPVYPLYQKHKKKKLALFRIGFLLFSYHNLKKSAGKKQEFLFRQFLLALPSL